ncbi:hypothetical protein ACFL0F_02610 [Patescibacteria group bacterium]
MKENKSLFILIFIFILVVLLALFVSQKRNITNFPFQEVTTSINQEDYILSIKTVISRNENGTPQIELLLTPETNTPLTLLALRVDLKSESGNALPITVNKANINSDLTSNNWSFPINELSKTNNQHSLDLSGFYIGPQKYILDYPIVIATIPLEEDFSENAAIGEYDENLTKFYGDDTKNTIPYFVSQ